MNRGERLPRKRSQTNKDIGERGLSQKSQTWKEERGAWKSIKRPLKKRKAQKKKDLRWKIKIKKIKRKGEIAEAKELANCSEEKHGCVRKLVFSAAAGPSLFGVRRPGAIRAAAPAQDLRAEESQGLGGCNALLRAQGPGWDCQMQEEGAPSPRHRILFGSL